MFGRDAEEQNFVWDALFTAAPGIKRFTADELSLLNTLLNDESTEHFGVANTSRIKN